MENFNVSQRHQVELAIEKFVMDESNVDMRTLIRAVNMIDDENILYRIATGTTCIVVGSQAVEKIFSDELLQKIALNPKVEDLTRITAAKHIKDQTMLKRLYEVGSSGIRKAVIELIVDDDFTYNAVFAEKAAHISVAAIKQIGSQEKLYNIAVRHKNPIVQIAAVNRIVDQNYLAKVAKITTIDASVRCAAIKKLNSNDVTELLYVIYRNDNNSICRVEAVKKIVDPGVLVDIASNDSEEEIQFAALSILPGISVFSEVNNRLITIIEGAYSSKVKAMAIKKLVINTNDFFVKVIRNIHNEEVRIAALNRIDDQIQLAKIAYYEVTKYQYQFAVRMEALKKLKNQDVINMIALSDSDLRIRELAVERACSATLINVAINDRESQVSVAAVKRLKNDYELIEVLLRSKEKWVQNAVVQQLCGIK